MSDKEESKNATEVVEIARGPQGKVTTSINVVIELDQEKLECINGPGITTTAITVT